MRLQFQENTYFSGLRNSSGMAEKRVDELDCKSLAGNTFVGYLCAVSLGAEQSRANTAKTCIGNTQQTVWQPEIPNNGETRKLSCNKEIFIKNILVFRTHRCRHSFCTE